MNKCKSETNIDEIGPIKNKIFNENKDTRIIIKEALETKLALEEFIKNGKVLCRFNKNVQNKKKINVEHLTNNFHSFYQKIKNIMKNASLIATNIDDQIRVISGIHSLQTNVYGFASEMSQKNVIIEQLNMDLNVMRQELDLSDEKIQSSIKERYSLMNEIDMLRDSKNFKDSYNITEEHKQDTKYKHNYIRVERQYERVKCCNERLKNLIIKLKNDKIELTDKIFMQEKTIELFKNKLNSLTDLLQHEKDHLNKLEQEYEYLTDKNQIKLHESPNINSDNQNLNEIKNRLNIMKEQITNFEQVFSNVNMYSKSNDDLKKKINKYKTKLNEFEISDRQKQYEILKLQKEMVHSKENEKSLNEKIVNLIKKDGKNISYKKDVINLKNDNVKKYETMEKLPKKLKQVEEYNEQTNVKIEIMEKHLTRQKNLLKIKDEEIKKLNNQVDSISKKFEITNCVLLKLKNENVKLNNSDIQPKTLNIQDLNDDENLNTQYVIKDYEINVSDESTSQISIKSISLENYLQESNDYKGKYSENKKLKKELILTQNKLDEFRKDQENFEKSSNTLNENLRQKLQNAASVNISLQKYVHFIKNLHK
ncbi:hypothetical protein A3Q56_07314 [Intoshia linei]|uniref:Uncharacterized protein n=1 Tax=Intoshia linei TaxID=1819745 RepID=A0A177AUA0_9BILA|nr:hypothetical protein A3Q56_07314 [Intoshia linei]